MQLRRIKLFPLEIQSWRRYWRAIGLSIGIGVCTGWFFYLIKRRRRLRLRQRKTTSSLCLLNNKRGRLPADLYTVDAAILGEGAFGTVRKVHNNRSGGVYVLKTINKAAVEDFASLEREIEIQSELDHPSIAKIYECYEDQRQVCMIMELCDGGSLFDLILKQSQFREPQAQQILRQIIRGVHYMHCKGFAHRDLKPENFLLKEKEAENTLKIIDFGMARRFSSQHDELRTACGTPYYTAPEVLQGPYSEKCDVWSCGIILYLLLCGEPPFVGSSPDEVFESSRRGELNLARQEFRKVSDQAKALLGKLCHLDVSARFSAEQALASEWFQRDAERMEVFLMRDLSVASNLRKFSMLDQFKKEASQIIAHHLDDKEIVRLRDTFIHLDTDGDGMLTLVELQQGLSGTDIDIQNVFARVDTDGSGTIDYTEFLGAAASRQQLLQEEACWEAFRVFDQDGDGKISVADLHLMLEKGCPGKNSCPSIEAAEKLLKQYDTNGDGEVDFEEFVAMVRS